MTDLKKSRHGFFFSGAVILLAISVQPHSLYAHEPVFSLGPETIWKNGFGIETELEFEQGPEGGDLAVHLAVIYGLTTTLSLSMEIPQIIRRWEGEKNGSGPGDLWLRGKFQLFKRDALGSSDKISSVFGVRLPTGKGDADPPLGSGTVDILLGMSGGHESRVWYYFATLRSLFRTGTGRSLSVGKFLYDVSFGYRPWRRQYLEWDLVSMLEMSGIVEPDDGSGTNRILFGPSGLLSYRNVMFKTGVQFPVYRSSGGNRGEDRFRSVLAVEVHF